MILPLKLEWEPCYWTMDEGVRVGKRVEVPLGEKNYIGVVSEVGISPTVTPSKVRGVVKAETWLSDVSKDEIALWREIAKYYMCTVGEVYKAAYPAGLVAAELKAAGRQGSADATGLKTKPISSDAEWKPGEVKLSEAQTAAREEILAAFDEGKTVLLNGVTGSGKTEIYINLALRALAAGQNVLYLVPEIALSRQLEARLRKVFGERLLVFHSGETPAKRWSVTGRVRDMGSEACRVTDGVTGSAPGNVTDSAPGGAPGNVTGSAPGGVTDSAPDGKTSNATSSYVVLGTRSAVFLPHHGLGLIVVDEEQDASYKQDAPAPRYNGRDVALIMAAGRCNVVLGSATPSLEALYNCQVGKFREVRLDKRYFETEDSGVEIIDTSAERRKRGMKGSFSRKLIGRIKGCLDRGEQVMILRTHRGYSPIIQCVDCGYIPRCPYCNVSLTYHKNAGKIRCHHCGYSLTMEPVCPKCGGEFAPFGAGTQKIEEEAATLFPAARIARLDSDVQQSRRAEKDIIKQFSSGAIDILIGTQIVTKGFDFSNVALVAVLGADALLGLQDFRADEKALQTLAQFRGRCGRRGSAGLLVIQTSLPDHPVYAALQDGLGDLRNERIAELLGEREEFGYPPFTRIINLSIKHIDESRTESLAKKLALELQDYRMDGPFAPSSGKNADQYVHTIRITLDKDRELSRKKADLLRVINLFAAKEHCQDNICIDVDPA